MIPRKSFSVKTMSAGSFTDGIWGGESISNSTIRASIQPLSPRQKASLPEGRKDTESYRLISSDLLSTVEEQNPDIVVIDGKDFEVHSRATWGNNILNHFDYTVIKIC